MLPFSIGFGELFVIVVVVLLVVGPAKLPEIARTLGKGMRMARRATRELQDAIQTEELKKPFIKPWEEVVKARDEVMDTILSVEAEVVDTHHPHGLDDDPNHPSQSAVDVKPMDGAVVQSSMSTTQAKTGEDTPPPNPAKASEAHGPTDG